MFKLYKILRIIYIVLPGKNCVHNHCKPETIRLPELSESENILLSQIHDVMNYQLVNHLRFFPCLRYTYIILVCLLPVKEVFFCSLVPLVVHDQDGP